MVDRPDGATCGPHELDQVDQASQAEAQNSMLGDEETYVEMPVKGRAEHTRVHGTRPCPNELTSNVLFSLDDAMQQQVCTCGIFDVHTWHLLLWCQAVAEVSVSRIARLAVSQNRQFAQLDHHLQS
jgi:hypothetical protein